MTDKANTHSTGGRLEMVTRKQESGINVAPIRHESFRVWIEGTSPLIYNAMSSKVKRGLLFPTKKTAADKQATVKHEPLREYRDSVYRMMDGPTLLGMPSTAIKAAMMSAALDMPGATKSQIGRLVYVTGELVAIYGTPKMHMAVTRSADMKRTPDVRTRAIMPRWAAEVEVSYAAPMLNAKTVAELLAAAGIVSGIGDFRVQKGRGTYGQFRVLGSDTKPPKDLIAQGRKEQETALESPVFYDYETEQLYQFWVDELERTGKAVAA